ncbi:MAG: transcription antitermination factor NusB [Treponema sp.]|nr:transcription antitermination factor NusB [Treponema sp.]
MSRRKGRVLAFQALYSYDLGNEPLEELLKLEWAHGNSVEQDDAAKGNDGFIENAPRAGNGAASDSDDYARILISGTIGHLEEVDGIIKRHLSAKWDFERLNRVTVAILRISVFCMLYQKDLPAPIIIDEAISIAKEYGSDDSFKFINAVLDNVKKEIA